MIPISRRLRHRVTFYESTKVRDSDGFADQEWTPIAGLADVPAEVLTGPGKEGTPAGQPQTTVAARITVRYLAALVSPYGLQVRHGASVYHVETFYLDAHGDKYLTLLCSTGEKYGE